MDANDSSCWREFDRGPVTHSAAHYLMAIDALRKEFGYARITDVAQRLEVTRGAASMAVAQLKRRALAAEDAHRFLLLTTKGAQVVRQVEHNFGVLSRFLEEVLGVPSAVAVADACKMEHLLSLQTGRRLVRFMRSVLTDRSEPGKQCPLCGAAKEKPKRRVRPAHRAERKECHA